MKTFWTISNLSYAKVDQIQRNNKDGGFSDVEKRLKYHPEVYCPKALYDIIREAREGSKQFTVIEMGESSSNSFISTRDLENSNVNRKMDTSKEKINWLNAKQIRVSRESPKSLFLSILMMKRKCGKKLMCKNEEHQQLSVRYLSQHFTMDHDRLLRLRKKTF